VKHVADSNLNDLFLDGLKDIYYVEKQILKSLPKMARAATSEKLRAAFEKHRDETEGQVERLEQIFDLLGKSARGKKCDAIDGIIDEGKEAMEEYKPLMPAFLPQPKPSSTTKSRAMARSNHGRRSFPIVKPPVSSTRP
jgi:hypothetical protein